MKKPQHALTKAASEKLERVRTEEQTALAGRLRSIGKDCAAHLKEPFRSADHGDLAYGEKDLTADR